MKVGDLVKRKRFSRKRRFHTTIYVITEVETSVYNNSYTLFTISQASENLRVYKKDLILLEDTQ